MAFALDDRVKETSTTTGTGTYDLAGAVTGFQTFVAGIGTGNTTWYSATDGTDWEVGIGTVTDATPDTLARTTILSSSNGDAAVNWGAGTRTLACTLPASRAFYDAGTAGQIPISSGSGGPITWATKPAGFARMTVFTATGANTWSKVAGLQFVVVECQGGGGGGAGSAAASGSGGGAGGYCRKTIAAASLAATETASVGGGGAGGTSGGVGTAGTSSTFGSFMTACGGGPGVTGASGAQLTGGSGGLATSGDINCQGGDGGFGGTFASGAAVTHLGAEGGNGFWGGGAQATRKLGASGQAGQTPLPARGFGAGGGGAVATTTGGLVSGSAGSNGIIIVWEFGS